MLVKCVLLQYSRASLSACSIAESKLTALNSTTRSSTRVDAVSKSFACVVGLPLATSRTNVLTPYQLVFLRAIFSEYIVVGKCGVKGKIQR